MFYLTSLLQWLLMLNLFATVIGSVATNSAALATNSSPIRTHRPNSFSGHQHSKVSAETTRRFKRMTSEERNVSQNAQPRATTLTLLAPQVSANSAKTKPCAKTQSSSRKFTRPTKIVSLKPAAATSTFSTTPVRKSSAQNENLASRSNAVADTELSKSNKASAGITNSPTSTSTPNREANLAASAVQTNLDPMTGDWVTEADGKTISVVPIGLGVFSGIIGVTALVIGFVTWQRKQFRAQFISRKKKLASLPAVSTPAMMRV